MKIIKPSYYDAFRCIAGACPDSCCKEWDVQVDAQAAEYYRGLPGALGDRLREVLREEDGETVMTIVDGRCPMWRQDGLCRIQAELGEEALCHVCREFPRLRHEYGDFRELGLELSCPEAAGIILENPNPEMVTQEAEGGEEPEYDMDAMQSLLLSRQAARELLADQSVTTGEALAALLVYGYQAQAELDGEAPEAPDGSALLGQARSLARENTPEGIPAFFQTLEILTETWETRLAGEFSVQLPEKARALARYLVDRYWLQAVSDYDLVCRVKFTVVACLLVGGLGGDYTETAQLFSKEIENDADNVDAILDGAYTCPAFTDDRLLGLLLTA